MKYVSYKQRRFLRLLLLSLLALFLAACSTTPDTVSPRANQDFAYVAPVDIDADMTQAELEAIHNGTALSFNPEAGFAILGFSEEQGQLSTLSTLEPNVDLTSPELLPDAVAEAAGWDAWAGGWDAWAGGWDAWAGGWDAWAGGVGKPTLPTDNKALFDMVSLSEAHDLTSTFGEGVVVAVIDSGVDLDHPMLEGRLVSQNKWHDYIDGDNHPQDEAGGALQGHGTAAAGIILQVAPKAKIMPLRVLAPNGVGDLANVIQAISWAVANGADVINMSLGSRLDIQSMQLMVNYAASQKVHVVASTGNHAMSSVEFPSRYATSASNEGYVVSVGSVSALGLRSGFSNYGPNVEFLAPGEKVVSAFPGNKIGAFTGTSFAAPMVSGMLALGLEGGVQPLEAHLATGASPVLGFNNGYGIPNIEEMLKSVKGSN